jgi:ABC-type glycerol-3-phosphate transport system substrate-binding protein
MRTTCRINIRNAATCADRAVPEGSSIVRYTKAAAAAVALAVAVSGCGGKKKDDSSKSTADPAKIVVWQMGDGSAEQTKFLDSVTAEFHQKHPKTAVQIQYVPWPQATQKFQTAIASGSGPDVTEVGNTDVQSWAEQGAFADITGKMKSWTEGQSLSKGALANDQLDGKTYAAPWYGGVRAVWYRTDWFKQLGLQPPTTWVDLESDAQKIQDKKKVPGIAAPSDFTNGILSFVWGNGGDVATKQGDKWVGTLDQPQAKEAIEFYAGLVNKDKVAPDKYVGKNELQGPQQDFALGKVGMYMDGSWALPQLEKFNKKDEKDWGVFPIPSKTGGIAPVFSGGSDLAVWKDSKYQDVAFDYLTTLDSKKNAKTFADTLKFLPQFTDVLQGGDYQSDPIMGPFAKAAASGVKFTPTSKGWADYEGAKKVLPNAVKAIMQGKSADDELKKADEQANTLLNQ